MTNGVASFWTIAEAGALKAGRDLNVDVDVRMPVEGVLDQKRIVEDLLARGIDGMAISPIDPDNQEDLVNEACDRTTVITHDSDAPRTRRLCYVGMDNYRAGRLVGKLVKEAMPEGGSVMLFVGRLEQLNASQRRQGVIDEVLDRPGETMGAIDPPNAALKGERYTILDTRTDQFDQAKAKANCEDAIARYPDLGCMVGLFAYNPPACLVALEQAGVDGIHLVGFDEARRDLAGHPGRPGPRHRGPAAVPVRLRIGADPGGLGPRRPQRPSREWIPEYPGPDDPCGQRPGILGRSEPQDGGGKGRYALIPAQFPAP